MISGAKNYSIYTIDRDGLITSWKEGAERTKGDSSSEIIGKSVTTFYLPEDNASGKLKTLLNKATAEGTAEDEGWRVRKNGSKFWASVVLTRLTTQTGALRGFSKITKDISERKHAEDAILH